MADLKQTQSVAGLCRDNQISQTLYFLGALMSQMGDYEAAVSFQREALMIRRKLLGAEHTDVAFSLNLLGGILATKGKSDEAERLLREALALHRKLWGNDHPATWG